MRLFQRKTDQQKALSPLPGMYAGEDPAQLIFDRGARITVEKNHWKLATLIAGVVALAAVITREPPPPQIRAYGVSADAQGKPVVRELQPYEPKALEIGVAVKELVKRMFTIEPVLTTHVEESRLYKNVSSAKKQMVGAARDQFEKWFDEDAPFKAITASPTLAREAQFTNIALLPDNTVAVEFVTTTTEEGMKPVKMRYAMTIRYEIKPPDNDAVLSDNPFGVHPVFFTLQKSPA